MTHETVLAIVRLSCYIISIVIVFTASKKIDYAKILKMKSNFDAYLTLTIVTLVFGYLLGDFLYTLITLFI